ncbi:MAG TPA: hypothetical protein VNQ32_07225 [Steroidobacteraceae bacterium]|nr:hypothetical protein [Steroidobacteraceae bacterium]
MAKHHLTLPDFNEPPLRIPVVARYSGPVLAAMRRHTGYQFMEPVRNSGERHPWSDRPALRRIQGD